MTATSRHFYQGEWLAVDQRRGAAEHGVGALHGFDGDAGAAGDGDTLADVPLGERMCDGAAVFEIGVLVFGGLAAGHHAGGGEQGLQERGGIGETDSFVFEDFGDAADQGIGVLARQGSEQFQETPVGADRRENLRMLDLAGHHDFGDAFGFENVDQAAELAERNPVAAGGQGLNFAGGFFEDTYGDHFVAQFAGVFERQNREAAVAGNKPVAHHFTNPRSESAMKASSSSSSGVVSISARIRSTACDVLRPARESRRKAFCKGSIWSPEEPRRSRPVRLAPKTWISRSLTLVE